MFDNIGQKIKTLAKVICWIGIVTSVIGAIVLFAVAGSGSGYNRDIFSGIYKITAVAILILGPLASWVSSFVLYGFGELIDVNKEIARNTRNGGIDGNTNDADSEPAFLCDECHRRVEKVSGIIITKKNGDKIKKSVCPSCREKLFKLAEENRKNQ